MTDQTPTYIAVTPASEVDGTRDSEPFTPVGPDSPKPYLQADMPGFRTIDPGMLEAMFGDERQ